MTIWQEFGVSQNTCVAFQQRGITLNVLKVEFWLQCSLSVEKGGAFQSINARAMHLKDIPAYRPWMCEYRWSRCPNKSMRLLNITWWDCENFTPSEQWDGGCGGGGQLKYHRLVIMALSMILFLITICIHWWNFSTISSADHSWSHEVIKGNNSKNIETGLWNLCRALLLIMVIQYTVFILLTTPAHLAR